jgi:hypothetical protein
VHLGVGVGVGRGEGAHRRCQAMATQHDRDKTSTVVRSDGRPRGTPWLQWCFDTVESERS